MARPRDKAQRPLEEIIDLENKDLVPFCRCWNKELEATVSPAPYTLHSGRMEYTQHKLEMPSGRGKRNKNFFQHRSSGWWVVEKQRMRGGYKLSRTPAQRAVRRNKGFCSSVGLCWRSQQGSQEQGQMGAGDISKPSVPALEDYTQMFCLMMPESVAGVPGPWEHLALEVSLKSLSVWWCVKRRLYWDLYCIAIGFSRIQISAALCASSFPLPNVHC